MGGKPGRAWTELCAEVWKSGLAALAPQRLGQTTEPRVALGFPSRWERSFPPHSLPVPVAGPVGRAAGGAEFSGGPLALGLRAGGGEQAPQALATFFHLAARQALGKQLSLGNQMGSASLNG